jgi:predicted nucleotidyltransferase
MILALAPLQLKAIKAACRQFEVHRLHLSGSALRIDFNPNTSDLDLLVQFKPIESTEHASDFFYLVLKLTAITG